jgi:hypothetical protein
VFTVEAAKNAHRVREWLSRYDNDFKHIRRLEKQRVFSADFSLRSLNVSYFFISKHSTSHAPNGGNHQAAFEMIDNRNA